MGKKALTYLAVLTGLYIVVYRSSNSGLILDKGSQAVATTVKPFLQ